MIWDIIGLKNAKGKGKNKRHKPLEVLENLELVFTGTYLHYGNMSKETMFKKVLQREQK